jgi:ABC-type phosphate/phosphonate transport system substrate-binding protein
MKRVLIAVALVAVLAGCGGSSNSAAKTGSAWPTSVKDGFVEGCAESGTSVAQCQCTANELEKILSIDDMIRLHDSGKISTDPRIRQAISKCA